MRSVAIALFVVAAAACSSTEKTPIATDPDAAPDVGAPDPATCGGCGAWADPEEVGRVQEPQLAELSGLAASRVHGDVYYTHNDSGDAARFFAIARSGAVLAEIGLAGVTAEDIEDVATGPCAEGSCVYLGDIGDNDEKRADVRVYRVPEPALASATVTPAVLVLRYPDRAHNAEAMMVSPAGELVIVTKSETGTSGVYALDASALATAKEATLRAIGTVTVPPEGGKLVTGASFHPCEKRVALRTYSAIFEYRFQGGLESLFADAPSLLPAGREGQGEAVAYAANGRAILTVGEGKRPAIHEKTCDP